MRLELMQAADNDIEPQRPRPLASLRRFKDPIHDFSEHPTLYDLPNDSPQGRTVPFSCEVCAIIDTYVSVLAFHIRIAHSHAVPNFSGFATSSS